MSHLDFPTTDQYTKKDIKHVQERLLEMAKIATNILDQNQVSYFITLGTLLGSVRHKGFIPWDDDFDVFVFDEEYEYALEVLRRDLPDDIIVRDRKTDFVYWSAWSVLEDTCSLTHSCKFPDNNFRQRTGIGIDLFRLKKVRRSEVNKYIKRENIEFLVRKYDAGVMSDDVYDKLFAQWTAEYAELMKIPTSSSTAEDEVYSFVLWMQQIELKDIFPLKKYDFEDTQFWGPNNYDALLFQAYGDYRKVPEFEHRTTHYDYVKFLK